MAIPVSKVRGIYSDYYSNGLPRHFVPRNDTSFYVILNGSEESHRVSEEYIFYGKPPSREFAASTARKDSILGLSIVRWDISLTLNMT